MSNEQEMREAFEKWFENRGVWPRLSYDEVFVAGYQAATLAAEARIRETCMKVAKAAIAAGMTEANHECTGLEDIKRADAEAIVNSVLDGK